MQTSNVDSLLSPRVMVNENGILWFDFPSGRLLGLDKLKYIRIATEQGDASGGVLYLVPSESLVPKSTFKIGKTGLYYYINLKRFFGSLNMHSPRKMISYNVQNILYEGEKIWILRKNNY